MSFALLFAGQGTQHAAMLPWLEQEPFCQPVLQAMVRATGANWRADLADPDTRSSNAFAQPLITGTSLAAWDAVRQQQATWALQSVADFELLPQVVAGYSVGELAAFAAAGVMDASTALDLAVQRAALMESAVAGLDTGLLSVSGIAIERVLAQDTRMDCAIHLAADHGIYAAESEVLNACAAALAAQGGLCKRLEVRVASHSRWMAKAASGFAEVLQAHRWSPAVCPVVLDAGGSASRKLSVLQHSLSQQMCSTVQWAACMDTIAETGVRCVLEIGAGSALSAMWNARHPHIPARSLEDFRDAQGAARWLARYQAA